MVQWDVPLDPEEQARRLYRAYRGVKVAKKALDGYRKTKDMLDDHAEQTDALIDAEGFVTRVREKRVHREDVRAAGRAIVNSAPKIYDVVARHIRKKREEAGDA